MDALGNIFNSIKTGIGSLGSPSTPTWQKLAQLGMGGAGAIGNLFASNKRNQVLNQELDVQKQLMNMTPGQLATGINSLTRPLSGALTSSVGNSVQGYLAERGLSEAPGIQAESVAQGLAPFELQEQQLATQAYLQKLGLPAQAAARFLPYPQSTDLTKLFQSLLTRPFSAPATQGPATTGTFPTQPDYNFPPLIPPPSPSDSGNSGGFDFMSFLSNPENFGMSPAF